MSQEDQDATIAWLEPRPILAAAPAVMAGYLALEDEETHYRQIAFERQAPMCRVWLRLLTLFTDAVAEQRQYPPTIADGDFATQLKIQMLAIGLGAGKPTLDAILAGYYVQALMLTRQMLETWVVVVYVTAKPDQAIRWYDEKPSDPSNKPPDDTRMHRAIRKSDQTKDRRAILDRVIADISRLNKQAHPTEQTLHQTVTQAGTTIKSGGNYVEVMAKQALHDGAHALRILLTELAIIVPQSDNWRLELKSAIQEHRAIMQPHQNL